MLIVTQVRMDQTASYIPSTPETIYALVSHHGGYSTK